MIKITLRHDGKRIDLLVPEQKSIREILLKEDVDVTPFDTIILEDKKIPYADLDKNAIELGFADKINLTLLVEEGTPGIEPDEGPFGGVLIHSAKVHVIGCACIIFSEFTPDLLRDFQRYMPEALVVRDDRGEPSFAIELDETSPGSLTTYGAVFSNKVSSRGKATITVVLDPECDNPHELVREKLGPAILSLISLEESLKTMLPDLLLRKHQLDDCITVD